MKTANPEHASAEGTRPPMRLLRVAFGVFVCLIWVVAVVFALELSATVGLWWSESHNEYILAAQRHESRQGVVSSPVRDKQDLCQGCAAQPGWSSFKRADGLPEWAQPQAGRSKEETLKRGSLFAGLDEANRDLFALLNDDIVLKLGVDGRIQHVYGNWLSRAPFEAGVHVPLLEAFEKSLRSANVLPLSATPAYLRMSLDCPAGVENNKEVLLLRGNSADHAFAFIDGDLQTIRFTALPPDSPWDGIPFFRYKKNLRDCRSGLGLRFDTNNYGFRDRDVDVPKPTGVTRILCIGGSTTEEGPTNDATYPKVLERALSTHFGADKRIEVFNCGVSGMTTSAHVARLADYLAQEPDMLVFYEGVNDIHRDLVEYWRSIDSPLWRRLLSHSRFLCWQWNSVLYPSDATIRAGLRGLLIENLRAIGYAARGRGIRMAICSVACPDADRLPGQERRFYDYSARAGGLDPCLNLKSYQRILELLNEEIRALCVQEGFLYIPVAEHIEGGYDTFSDIYHMTDSGIERKGEVLFECLKAYLRSAP